MCTPAEDSLQRSDVAISPGLPSKEMLTVPGPWGAAWFPETQARSSRCRRSTSSAPFPLSGVHSTPTIRTLGGACKFRSGPFRQWRYRSVPAAPGRDPAKPAQMKGSIPGMSNVRSDVVGRSRSSHTARETHPTGHSIAVSTRSRFDRAVTSSITISATQARARTTAKRNRKGRSVDGYIAVLSVQTSG